MPNLQSLTPIGLHRLFEAAARLRRFDRSPWRALSQEWRIDVSESGIDMFPPSILQNPLCVVDVGANIGRWSAAVARLTSTREILAYEPNPLLVPLLTKVARRYPQITVIPAAVGAEIGTSELLIEERHELSSMLPLREELRLLYGATGKHARPREVPVRTLDQDLSDRTEISILKIDVQGFEPAVLAGAKHVLRKTKALMIEVVYQSHYHNDVTFDQLYRMITQAGQFSLYGVSSPHCSPSGQPMWADAVFVQNV